MVQPVDDDEADAVQLLKLLRHVDQECGVRNSRIAFDVALAMFEISEPAGSSVEQLVDTTGYSGPTIRLILKRLEEFGTTEQTVRVGKTRFYALTKIGRHNFAGYIRAIEGFRKG